MEPTTVQNQHRLIKKKKTLKNKQTNPKRGREDASEIETAERLEERKE